VKENIRAIGIDDSAFLRDESTKAFVFGVIVRGHTLVEGILRTDVEIDGWDATDKISEMIITSKFTNQLKAIILGSSTIAAFNIIDLRRLFNQTSIPVLTVLSHYPEEKEVKQALSHLADWEKRYEMLYSNPNIQKIEYKNQIERQCKIYAQHIGFKSKKEVKELLQITSFSSCIPECLRLADLIGQSFKDYII